MKEMEANFRESKWALVSEVAEKHDQVSAFLVSKDI